MLLHKCFMFVYVLISFILNIILFLIFTLIIATITLMERKLLALIQRRVGPNYIGFKGRFQFIADALKLLLKHIYVIRSLNKLMFLCIPAFILIMCYLFWINIVWGPNLMFCEVEYNLIFSAILSTVFSLLLFLTGWISKNKYAILSSLRVIVMILNLEILFSFLIVYLLLLSNSFSFSNIIAYQSNLLWNIWILLPALPTIIIIFLLETNRIPFDLAEAESELIAGYTTEMGGFFFALFYLGEYFHLYFFSFTFVLLFFGG